MEVKISQFVRRYAVAAAVSLLAAHGALAEAEVRSRVAIDIETQPSVREQVPITPPQGVSASLADADAIAKAPPALQDLGVGWYALAGTADGARLALLTPAGTEVGAFTVRHRVGEGRTLSPEWLDGRFEDPRGLSIQVWTEARSGLLAHVPLEPVAAGDLRSVSAETTTCNTSFVYYSGLHIGLTRSLACERATLDVSGRCSNSACWGCCRFLECDCACMAGDFNCVCTRGGNACALQGCEYQIIPDPETCDPIGGGGTGGGGGGGWDPGTGSGGSGGTTCVDVSCNGSYAGQACGTTTEQIVEAAWDMC